MRIGIGGSLITDKGIAMPLHLGRKDKYWFKPRPENLKESNLLRYL